MKAIARWLTKALASCFFLTYLPARWRQGQRFTGAGLIGTFFGLLSAHWLPMEPGRTITVLIGAFCIAVAISDYAEKLMGRTDDPRIVIDEWVGYWVSIVFLPHTRLILSLGFILFRLFDVLKLPWIRRSGELTGGWGIVMDDVLAGVLANFCLHLIRYAMP